MAQYEKVTRRTFDGSLFRQLSMQRRDDGSFEMVLVLETGGGDVATLELDPKDAMTPAQFSSLKANLKRCLGYALTQDPEYSVKA